MPTPSQSSGTPDQSSLPLVSAVIPTYNRAHLVPDALDSIARQTYRPIEIVVVDDGSTDDTQTVVLSWAARHPEISTRYLQQQKAGGNAARNQGVLSATGKFVAFLDSDDLWHPTKIARQVDLLRDRPGYGAVYTGVREVRAETGEVLDDPIRRYPEGDLLGALLVSDVTAPTSTCLVRRSIIVDAGLFDVTLAARQDWDMWIRLAERAKIGCVPEALVDLRHHSGPRTASDPTRELAAFRRILEKYEPLRRSRGLHVILAARASYFRRKGRVQFHFLGRRGSALGSYLIAIALWPFEPDSWAALLGALLPTTLRGKARRLWNRIFGRTALAIRSH